MSRLHREESGQAVVLIVIVMLGMIMAVGLAMDTGQLYNGRRTAQEAADAAAFAGATVIYQQGCALDASGLPIPPCSAALDAATSDAALNRYAADTPTSGTTVAVAHPPTAGARAGDVRCIRVTISTPVRTSLVPQQATFTTVQAHSTACSLKPLMPYGIMTIDQQCAPSDIPALYVGGSLSLQGGSIQVNACTPHTGYDAINNSGTITLSDGYETDVVGTATSGSWPELQTGQKVQADPFAGTPKPSTNGLTSYGTPACSPTVNQPGIYTGNANGNCMHVFAPGTYVFEGAGIQLSGSSAGACTGRYVSTSATATIPAGTQTVVPASMTNVSVGKMLVVDTGTATEGVVPSAVTPTSFTAMFAKAHSGTWSITGGCQGGTDTADGGVFFFFTNSAYPATGGSCGNPALKIEGGVSTELTAPTSGTYKGLLFWQDSVCTVAISIGSASGALYTSGSVYAPNADITGNGNGATMVVSQMIAKTVNTQNADFTMNYVPGLNFTGNVPAIVE
ncbi:MAG: hypothetical protein KGN00_09355 [Chloroflexota bacterium]|nr:hypothetical protein [Chloroflexota bacterium]